jgi:hypothetical protein
MVDKKNVGLEPEDLASLQEFRNGHVWDTEEEKPEVIATLIGSIKSMFDVGKEVKGWSASYFKPPTAVSRKYESPELSIPPVENKLGARFMVVIGSREIANLSVSTGSVDAESPVLLMPGDCMFLKITVCPVLTTTFKNLPSERMAARKGFRETSIKKNPQNRHVLVLDAHVEMKEVVNKVKNDLLPEMGAKKAGVLSSLVAKMASVSTEESEEPVKETEERIPELVPSE